MAGIKISIDSREAKRGADEVNKALESMATAAAKSVAEMDKIRGALTRQQEAQKAARAAGLEEVAVLQSKIKIQQQVQAGTLSLAQATRRMAEADIFAKTGNRELAQALAATRAEYDKNAAAMRKVGQDSFSVTGMLTNLRAQVLASAAAFISLQGAAKFIQIAEDVNSLRAQIANLGGIGEQAVRVFERLQASAKDIGTPLEAVVDVFSKLQFALQPLGASNAEILKVVETLQKAGAVGRVTADNMAGALLQLGQIFAQGKFQADELNVILTRAQPIIQLIADGAGKTTAELIKMARAGKYDVFQMFKDIASQADEVNRKFAELPPSVSRATAAATVTIGQAIDELNQKLAITHNIAKGIQVVTAAASQAFGLETETEQIKRLRTELQALTEEQKQRATSGNMFGRASLQGPIDAIIRQLSDLEGAAAKADAALGKAAEVTKSKYTEAQLEAAAETQKFIKRTREQAETMNLSGAALAEYVAKQHLATTGNKELSEEVYKVVLAEEKAKEAKKASAKATQDATEAAREAKRIEKQEADDKRDILMLSNKLDRETEALRKKESDATAASLATLQNELIVMQEEGRLIQASLGTKEELRNIELSIARARIEREAATKLVADGERTLTDEEKKTIEATKLQALANVDAAASFTTMKESIEDAALTTADLKSVTQGILSGTQSIGDIFEDLGQTAGVRMVEGIMFGKGGKEKEILMNFNQLLGVDAAGIFGAQGFNLGTTLTDGIKSSLSAAGLNLGSLFGSSMVEGAKTNVGILGNATVDASTIEWQSAAQTEGSALGTIFGAAMAGAAGIALGKGLTSMFGGGGSKQASTGGNIGGSVGAIAGGVIGTMLLPGIGTALGAAIGGMVGSIGGSLIGGLFASTPTRGTEIRKGAKKFLKEIEASFASEIDSGDYFFEETKKLAKKMFGGDGGQDFLKASKVILNDKIGPELGKQLQALGTLITAKQAQKLGKDVEQTGTTFGNMLLDNLGLDPEEIQGAIDEIVSKAGISFDVLTDKLSKLFEEGEIGAKFYTDAIEGAVSIFFQDLPDAIGAAKLAMQSFGEDGIFDLEKFTAELEKVTATFDVLVASFVDVVANSEAGEDIGKLLADQIAMGLETLAVNQFLTKFIEDELFKGIDLTNGLDADELALIQTRAGAARGEVEKLWAAFGEVGKEVEATEEKVEDLFEKIRDLTNQRFELRLNVIGDLESIGAISGADAARARIGANSAMVSRFANPNGLGARISDFVSDAELEQAREAVAQTRQATVELFQAQEQAAQDALAKRIRDINTDYDARRKSLAKEAAAAQDASEARLSALAQERDDTQKLFQERIDGLQEELQIAQEFRQVAESIQDTINGLVQSSSRFSGPEQIAIFEQQAAGLRQRLQGTTGAERAAIIGQLSEVLQQQLAAGEETMSQEAFSTMFDSVVKELESLRDEAAVEGDRVEQIQNAIAQTTAQMQISLESIDAQMEAERVAAEAAQDAFAAQAEALSVQETAAITAAQAATDAEIAALRMEAVVEIQKLAVIEDQILAEQLKRAEYEVALTEQQVTILGNINTGIVNLTTAITGFLDSAISAQTGYEGWVRKPQLFITHPNEHVRISPSGPATSNQVTFAPSISVSMTGSGTTEVDAQKLARGLSQAMLNEWRNGQMGREIRQTVERKQ